MEPVLAKAARKLGIDQVAIRRVNAPAGKAPFGPPNARGQRGYATSAFVKEALDRGAELFKWDERKARSGQRQGSKVRGVGVAVSTFVAGSTGFDGLFVIKPDGQMYIQSGIGNLGTESVFDCHRVAAEMMGMPWEKVEVAWGDTSQEPAVDLRVGRQPDDARDDARGARGGVRRTSRRLQEIAAKTLGGSPDSYKVANERVSGNGRSMTLAEVARKAIELGGVYDGHELPKDINAFTDRVGDRARGAGADGRRARQLSARRRDASRIVAGFAEVEVDVETGQYQVLDYLAVADVGTVLHPHSLGGQVLGRSVLGMGHALAQKTGVRPALRRAAGEAVLSEPPADDPRRADQHAVGGAEHSGSRDAGRRARHRRAAGRRRLLRRSQRALRRGRRRRLSAARRSRSMPS